MNDLKTTSKPRSRVALGVFWVTLLPQILCIGWLGVSLAYLVPAIPELLSQHDGGDNMEAILVFAVPPMAMGIVLLALLQFVIYKGYKGAIAIGCILGFFQYWLLLSIVVENIRGH